ncbi:acetylornithine and succinylornithine aminotransferase [Kribbella flavida DSM 17836]|uniref:Acetylornithine aminotransferase n=1 Tax=Kribbella flavida (strain DSM 17836 / JCM 10339 / NBRC 14399) TaxID=479435 RepID=D2PM78_KRIFD|nr:acetylornithine and succinylornithine aminotransferase [Kribbella flavida DSM 17836]
MTDLMPPELNEMSATGSTGAALTERYTNVLMNTFGPPKRVLVRGEGAYLWDADGRKYLDLLGGLAVNSLGHAHPFVVSAVTSQLATLGHVSNFFASAPQIALAEKLLSLVDAPGGKVFFTNSGTEANEAAFKITRRTGRTRIVAAVGGFHGRSMGALAITWKPAYREQFAPLPGDVTFVPYGDAAALEAAVDDETAAVVLEPIQGENGVIVPPAGYLQAARRITAAHGTLLWIDEIQTGIGRTGDWFAFQAEGISPDLVTVAKGLGAGIPIGACLAFGPAAELLQPGNHGTTFGGNPVATIAGLAVLTVIERDGLLARVKAVGNHLAAAVEALDHPLIAGVRGRGLLLAIELTAPVSDQVTALALEAGFVINNPVPDALRLAPPYILSKADADTFVAALPALLNQVEAP